MREEINYYHFQSIAEFKFNGINIFQGDSYDFWMEDYDQNMRGCKS